MNFVDMTAKHLKAEKKIIKLMIQKGVYYNTFMGQELLKKCLELRFRKKPMTYKNIAKYIAEWREINS